MKKELLAFYEENADPEQLKLIEKLLAPQFALKDMDVKPQYVNLWRNEGILFNDASSRGGKPFSFIDYIWVKMIEKMKLLGIHYEIIRKVKAETIAKPFWFTILDLAAKHTDLPIEFRGEDDKVLTAKEAKILWSDKIENTVSLFAHLIARCIADKRHLAFWINADGQVAFVTDKKINGLFSDKALVKMYRGAFVSISITEIVREFIDRKELNLVSEEMNVISEEEKQVLELIRDGKLTELKIRFDKANQIDLIEATKEEPLELKSRFLDVITQEGYQDITFTTEKGTIVKFRNTIKIKPKKKD